MSWGTDYIIARNVMRLDNELERDRRRRRAIRARLREERRAARREFIRTERNQPLLLRIGKLIAYIGVIGFVLAHVNP